MDMEHVFLLEKNIWVRKMSSCWRRRYGYGRCLLVGKEYMGIEDVDMDDVFLWRKNFPLTEMFQ